MAPVTTKSLPDKGVVSRVLRNYDNFHSLQIFLIYNYASILFLAIKVLASWRVHYGSKEEGVRTALLVVPFRACDNTLENSSFQIFK